MATLGANTDQLNALATSLQRAASTLQQCEHSLHTRLQSTVWTGRDAALFRQRWISEHRQPLQRAHADLKIIAARLRDQALEQQSASNVDTAGLDALAWPPVTQREIDAAVMDWLDTGPLDAELGDTRSPAQQHLDNLPTHETTIAGGVTLSVLFFRGRFNGQLAFATQPDGTVATTYTDRVTGDVGLKVGATAGIAFGDMNTPRVNLHGAAAGIDAGLHLVESRTWITEADEVAGLLVRLAATELGGAPVAVAGVVAGAASAIERALGGGLGIAQQAEQTLRMPTPHRQEVGIGANGSVYASTRILNQVNIGGSAQERMTVGMRTTELPSGEPAHSVVVRIEASSVAQITTHVGNRAGAPLLSLGGIVASGTVEIPLNSDGQPTGMTIYVQEQIGTLDGNQTEHVIHFGLTESTQGANADHVASAIEHASNGNISRMIDELGQLDFVPDSASYAQQSVVVDGGQARAGTEVGLGGRIGLVVDGQYSTTDRNGG